ncbi:PqqD family protein [Sphingomonas parva]|uniref:PqqD family protein n=1 Tax=Sphingomonas parva TaxID=2555898 RepID=A0A4Y8ZW57_9SPHN|nr:PqqD family protein [Sphingomonas parva]TFI60258.1 PqqD family protein [Sphingomonas parva]
MDQFSSDMEVQRRPEILHSRVDDAVYALDTASGACFAFHGPSARLWELLGEPITPAAAARRLVEQYQIDEESCRREVADHFTSLHGEGLIVATGR